MLSRHARGDAAGTQQENVSMDWKLEVVVVPVSDVDRAKRFYSEQVGFNVDLDTSVGDEFRVVQLTPPGSACSISIGKGLADSVPGSLKGMQLVVTDIEAAWAQLVERGVDVSPIRTFDNGVWLDGKGGPWNSFLFFSDPDDNGWTVQEKPADA
jgi:predicted enzyme related to lactoylglutathione lyase